VQEGQKGVEAKYIQSPEYHEAWKVQARDVLARAEFRKRKLTQRVRPSAPTYSLIQQQTAASMTDIHM